MHDAKGKKRKQEMRETNVKSVRKYYRQKVIKFH